MSRSGAQFPLSSMFRTFSIVHNNITMELLCLQLVAIPNPLPVQQKEAVKPKPLSVATKQSPAAGK